jgi:hypothetical protein
MNRVCNWSGVAASCPGWTAGEEGKTSLITGNEPLAEKRCPTINPPEKAPATRISPTNAPRIVLVVLLTKASRLVNETRAKILCGD